MRNYICTLNEAVERKHVRYNNRYGFALAGDLYTAKDMDKNSKYPAVVVGAPYGGVKEQGPSVYANELAKRGFVVLTFDPCYMGESSGEPRHVSSPDMFSENISAGCGLSLGHFCLMLIVIGLVLSASAEAAVSRSQQRQWICALRQL